MPYEVRVKLGGGLPVIVLTTVDEQQARAVLGALRARRHGAILCDDRHVVASDDMVAMRRFAFEDGAIVAGHERLPFDDVYAVLRASHKRETESRAEVVEKKTSVRRALMTGGLITAKEVAREERRTAVEREQVLYLFRRTGVPWLLRQHSAYYQGLGFHMGVSQHENFQRTWQLLREQMPHATFDDRLVSIRRVPERARGTLGRTFIRSNADGMDLLAHVLARWIYETGQAQPYRR
jgi:hypothetical protein